MEAPASTPMKGALLIGNTDGSNGERGRGIVGSMPPRCLSTLLPSFRLSSAAAAVVPSAIHAPLTGLFFIATAPERSTQAAERFSPPGNGDTRKQGRKGSVLGKSVRAAGGFAVENQSPVRSCKQG